jgi:hypothetical protein
LGLPAFSKIVNFSLFVDKNALRGAAAFDKIDDDITERIHSLNLLTDIDAFLGFNALHVIALNPHHLNDLIPFAAHENCNYTSNGYEKFLKELIRQIPEHNLHFVAVICDNYPAGVNGVWQSLPFVPHLAICHIACRNQTVNLAFVHMLEHPTLARRAKVL